MKFIFVRVSPEVVIKKHFTRHHMIEMLKSNIADALQRHHISFSIQFKHNAFLIQSERIEQIQSILSYVFGIDSVAVVKTFSISENNKNTVAEILKIGSEIFANEIRNKTFAVRVKKQGPMGFSSRQIEKELGALLYSQSRGVNLTHPEVIVQIDIFPQEVYFYLQKHKGAGGLPLRTQSSALVLLSGGFDSSVAAWKILKRGVPVHFLYCHIGGKSHERQVLQIAKVLSEMWTYGSRPQFFIVDFNSIVEEIKKVARSDYRQVILKRAMFQAAQRLAQDIQCEAIVTGESLGQVSSQTLSNLKAIDSSVHLPVLRPLIGEDKKDIIALAQKVGTAILSEKVRESCWISDGKQATHAMESTVFQIEEKINKAIFDEAFLNIRQMKLHLLKKDDLRDPYLFAEKIDNTFLTIDLQTEASYRSWHAPNAIRMSLSHIDKEKLDKTKKYLAYCSFGSQAPLMAEILQQSGYQVYACSTQDLRRALVGST